MIEMEQNDRALFYRNGDIYLWVCNKDHGGGLYLEGGANVQNYLQTHRVYSIDLFLLSFVIIIDKYQLGMDMCFHK